MDDEHIKITEADGIVTITLNRPDRWKKRAAIRTCGWL
jgi:hypothetical protein